MLFGSIWHSQVAFLDASPSSSILLFYVEFHFAMLCIFNDTEKDIGIIHVLLTFNFIKTYRYLNIIYMEFFNLVERS